jgi:hypothetical protein
MLDITSKRITITGKDQAGLLYGFITLEQTLEDAKDQGDCEKWQGAKIEIPCKIHSGCDGNCYNGCDNRNFIFLYFQSNCFLIMICG